MRKQDQLTYEDLLQIVELIKSSPQFTEFHLKVGDIEIDLRRGGAAPRPETAAAADPAPKPVQRSHHVGGGELVVEPAAPPPKAPAPAREGAQAWPEGSVIVRSPMVGTFYRAPEPGARPFVEVGQAVAPDTVVCIIEVMKLMNSIPAGASGVVTQVLVEDAAPVEYGQPLVVLRPS
ncbi:MAG: acetyl-CoA carboxylase biotin carboxyl carrier protein [Betaproteobacteria bacterium]|nr:acetyl-CoA carboxylase biotin carboxyl carrier protein [Betaproteobacteria bacterium]